MVDKEKITW